MVYFNQSNNQYLLWSNCVVLLSNLQHHTYVPQDLSWVIESPTDQYCKRAPLRINITESELDHGDVGEETENCDDVLLLHHWGKHTWISITFHSWLKKQCGTRLDWPIFPDSVGSSPVNDTNFLWHPHHTNVLRNLPVESGCCEHSENHCTSLLCWWLHTEREDLLQPGVCTMLTATFHRFHQKARFTRLVPPKAPNSVNRAKRTWRPTRLTGTRMNQNVPPLSPF